MKLTAAVLALASLPAWAAEPRRMTWNELHSVAGMTVRIALPDAVIEGKTLAVEPAGLRLQVRRTTNPVVYPKGEARVPSASVKTLQIRAKTKRYRIIGTSVGCVIGFAGGVVAAFAISKPTWSGQGTDDGVAGVVGVAIWGGVTAAGYAIGNAADKKWQTVVLQ